MTEADDRPMVKRTESFEGYVSELFDWCAQRELDPTVVYLPGCHLKYFTPQSDEEAERVAQFKAAADARHEQWERSMWEKLKVKFGAP